MSPVMIEMILDLHLHEKLMSQPVPALSPKYPERLFSSVNKSNIEM